MPPRRLILRSFQSPGDVVMLTAAVRDLHLAHQDKFETDVRTSADAIWNNNPYITRLSEGQQGVEHIEMHYALIHECNQRPYHFLHGYPQYLEQQLGVRIPLTRFSGDIHLSAAEKNAPPPGAEMGVPEHFWIILAGGKYDFTAKWWNPEYYQAVVSHFRGKIQFVQCGEHGHWHPPLEGVINLVGKTDTRSFIRLVYHADGVLCPVTFAMHLAAAVETKPGRPKHRPCVVIAGGREPPHWEAYPHHRHLSTVGALPCCADGGCWKSRCQPVGDGDMKDRHDLCVDPVQVRDDLRIPRCMELITPQCVIESIELYYKGGALKMSTNGAFSREGQPSATFPAVTKSQVDRPQTSPTEAELRNVQSQAEHGNEVKSEITTNNAGADTPGSPEKQMNVLINFRHGFGDAIQLIIILKHLQKYRPNWNVDVAALVGKHSAFRGLCRKVCILEREFPPCCEYGQRFNLDWHECHTAYGDSPSTKAERCLREEFGIAPDPELCSYSIQVSDQARDLARRYLDGICTTFPPLARGGQGGSLPTNDQLANQTDRYPVVLIHFEGNTSSDMKNIPAETIRRLCDDIIEEGFVPVILDWDYRNTLADGVRIHCPDQRAELWHGTGTGDAESLAALTELSSLMVGVDSGPLHVAGATTTPTLGVWTRHHPLHYFSHAGNVTHLVPHDHAGMIRGDRQAGEAYFAAHYQIQSYRDLEDALRVAVRSRLHHINDAHADSQADADIHDSGLVFTRDFWIRTDNGEQDLVVVQDVAEQDCYRIDELPMPRPVIIDVGAHIGCFAKRIHQRNPSARVFAVECCPENISVLQKNAGEIATVIQGAVTYEPDVALLNAVYGNCLSTGGSTIVTRAELERRVMDHLPPLSDGEPHYVLPLSKGGPGGVALASQPAPHGTAPFAIDDEADPIRIGEYWADFRPIRTFTLEHLMREHRLDHIDILKLDCEGSEFSILGKTPSLERIGIIVGEYHGKEQFDQLVAERFAGWNLRILRDGDLGTFWLTNPAFNSNHPSAATPALSREAQPSATLPAAENTPLRLPPYAGNGHVESKSGMTSFQYASIQTRSLDGSSISFTEVLRLLRDASANDQIRVHGFAASAAIRQACDTFTSEHPEFDRKFIDEGSTQTLLFERRSRP